MGNPQREKEALKTALSATAKLRIEYQRSAKVGVILGSGLGDAFTMKGSRGVWFGEIPGFDTLGHLEGHHRRLEYGMVADKEVLVLKGRVHLNEGHNEDIVKMVRLQTEMLLQMGVNRLIVTSAVGSLVPSIPVGSIAIVKSFVTLFAPPMPLWAGEFFSPEDMLDESYQRVACEECWNVELKNEFAVHVMVRGPFFEGRLNDKRIARAAGGDVIGMSMLPEACVASVYDTKVLGLGFVTNDANEEHSHQKNLAIIQQSTGKVGALLTRLIGRI